MLGGTDAYRLAGTLLLPEAEQSLFEPREDRRVSPRAIQQPPAHGLGMSPLVIVEHDPRVLAVLAFPLALRQKEPIVQLAQASLQGVSEGTAAPCLTKPTSASLRPDCSQSRRIRQ